MEISEMAYRELQAECKRQGVSAKGTRAELIARLLGSSPTKDGAAGQPAEGPASPRAVLSSPRTSARAKTPRATKAAGAVPVSATATASTPAAASPSRAKERLRQAAQTPLPRSPPPETPLPPPQKPRRRSTPLSLGSLLTLAALCAALAALVVPACHQYGCTAALRRRYPASMEQADQLTALLARSVQAAVPESLVAAAAQHWAQGRAHLEHAWQHAQRSCFYWRSSAQQWLEGKLRREVAQQEPEQAAQPEPPSCTGLLNTEALDNIVPSGPVWDNLKQTAAAAWGGQWADPTKAPAMLFGCLEANCPAVSDWLAWAVPNDSCRLRLEASELGDDRGALQKALATFLAQEPNGTVLISNVHQLSPPLVSVLINALSEYGAFEQDGRAVPTTSANFIMTMQMPREILDAESEAAFKVNAKAHLVQALAGRAVTDPEEALGHAKALRRRIEFVLPTLF